MGWPAFIRSCPAMAVNSIDLSSISLSREDSNIEEYTPLIDAVLFSIVLYVHPKI
jgi:hypothetical protein